MGNTRLPTFISALFMDNFTFRIIVTELIAENKCFNRSVLNLAVAVSIIIDYHFKALYRYKNILPWAGTNSLKQFH